MKSIREGFDQSALSANKRLSARWSYNREQRSTSVISCWLYVIKRPKIFFFRQFTHRRYILVTLSDT
jgi:hypothetical protein